MDIPIQNIYYLLCYAWDKLEEREIVDVKDIDSTEILDLFCKVLIGGSTHLLKKGLDRDYITYQEDTASIRGKINFNESIKRNLMRQARLNCEYDELSYNILHNQILKATFKRLLKNSEIDKELKKELKVIYDYFYFIDDITLSDRAFDLVRLNRNNYFYDFLLKICRLLYDNYFISEDTGAKKFKDFTRDEVKMRMLFEEFLRNFYRKEQDVFRVYREDIKWQFETEDESAEKLVPKMQTDISLESSKRKIIIDAKYYREILNNNQGSRKLRSANLYQMFAYLKSVEDNGDVNKQCEGILIYPTTDKKMSLQYKVSGHKFSVRTINLNQEWRNIHNELLEIIAI